MKYVAVFGNPFDGMNVVGPFETSQEALDYAELTGDGWFLVEMEKPKALAPTFGELEK